MNAIADFTIIGRVGEIKEVGTTVRVSVASSYSGRDSRGDWADHTRWNEVTIFNEKAQGYVKRNLGKGDLVFTTGTLGQASWEKNGGTFYGVTLAARQIERLCKGPNRAGVGEAERQDRRSAQDKDVPF
jgi:single-strand DNA-binding protein